MEFRRLQITRQAIAAVVAFIAVSHLLAFACGVMSFGFANWLDRVL